MINQLEAAGILPAVTLDSVSNALPVARALVEGGLNVMEITFRTDAAADSISQIREHLPEMLVGAGTVLTQKQLYVARAAGAQFILAPGFNPSLVRESQKIGLPFIPGVMTPSEIEGALALGCTVLKLFPMELIGGVAMLKALSGPYGATGVRFIPMGGVNPGNMKAYLALKNVLAVGGSWLASEKLVAEQDYEGIKQNTRNALILVKELERMATHDR